MQSALYNPPVCVPCSPRSGLFVKTNCLWLHEKSLSRVRSIGKLKHEITISLKCHSIVAHGLYVSKIEAARMVILHRGA